MALGDDAAISMIEHDGTLLARYPQDDALIGRSFKGGALLELLRPPRPEHGTMRLDSPLDGPPRVGRVRRLRHFPIVVPATRAESAAPAAWRDQTRLLNPLASL